MVTFGAAVMVLLGARGDVAQRACCCNAMSFVGRCFHAIGGFIYFAELLGLTHGSCLVILRLHLLPCIWA